MSARKAKQTENKPTRKKLRLSKQTLKDLIPRGTGPMGGWPTATYGLDGQCTARHSGCI